MEIRAFPLFGDLVILECAELRICNREGLDFLMDPLVTGDGSEFREALKERPELRAFSF